MKNLNTPKKMKEKVSYNVKKEIEGNKNKVGFYKFNKEFIEDFFLKDKTMLEANIYVHRILANIGLSLKNEQFYKANDNFQTKLNFFDEEFMTEDNSGISFTMNSIEICKGANYSSLEEALNMLDNYQRGWYDSINSKGERIRSLGGLISNPVLNKKSGNFQFFITAHWLKKLLHLTEYNQTYYKLTQEISSNKHMLFWYWLSILPNQGTQVSFETLNERFDLNYKTARDVCKAFLKPIKNKFDDLGHISFNYTYKGNIIYIAKFRREPEEFKLKNEVQPPVYEELKKRYKISYISKRHKLTERQIGSLTQLLELKPSLFLESYSLFISECRATKKAATSFTDESFIKVFQELIIKVYRDSSTGQHYPNGYPKINV